MPEDSLRRTLALLCGRLCFGSGHELCAGAAQAARENNVDLTVFPGPLSQGVSDGGTAEDPALRSLRCGYTAALRPDAAVLCTSGVGDDDQSPDFSALLDRFDGIPLVLLESRLAGRRCITVDSGPGMRGLVRHLAEEHRCRKLCYVSARGNNYNLRSRRLAFLEGMAALGLAAPESRFCTASDEEISRLLDDTPDADAVCCSDDETAAAVCRILRQRGLLPGRDIAVTGFGDVGLETGDPPLTTARVDFYSMGYHAVGEALRLLDGLPQRTFSLDSAPVLRASCGCAVQGGEGLFLEPYLPLDASTIRPAAEELLRRAQRFPANPPERLRSRSILLAFLSDLLDDLYRPVFGTLRSPMQDTRLRRLGELCGSELSPEKLSELMESLLLQLGNQIADPQRRYALLELRLELRRQLNEVMLRNVWDHGETLRKSSFLAVQLIRGTLTHQSRSPAALREICAGLDSMGMRSACLFTCSPPLPTENGGRPLCAERLCLAADLTDGRIDTPEGCAMGAGEILRRSAALRNRQAVTMVFCLVTGQEQHGLLLCENDLSRSFCARIVSMQIGAALEFFYLLEQRTSMEARLKEALATISRKSEMLQMLSTTDDLTGILNRRGFLERMLDRILETPGQPACLCMMDLDNLKSINDTFGHAEGDYAITGFVDILRRTVAEDCVFGRFGGDEFTLLLPGTEAAALPALRERLEDAFRVFNRTSRKPYFIEPSFGFFPFVCRQEIELESLLREADLRLYEDKRTKRTSAVKAVQGAD